MRMLFLDPGSDSKLIRKDLADHQQLVGESYQVSLNTVGSDAKTQHLNRVSFGLSSKDLPEPVIVNGAWAFDKLNIMSVKVPKNAAVDQWSHLSGIDLPELDSSEVMLLIGSDVAHLLIHLEVRQGRVDEPITIETPLGWTLFCNANTGLYEVINANLLLTNEGLPYEEQIERFRRLTLTERSKHPPKPLLLLKTKEPLLSYRAAQRQSEVTIKHHCYGNVSQSCPTTALWQFQGFTQPGGNLRRTLNWPRNTRKSLIITSIRDTRKG